MLRVIASAFAIAYFLIDGVLLALLRPVLRWLGSHPWMRRLQGHVAALGPYPTLLLLLAPLILLEPGKLLGVYLMASGQPVPGAIVLAVAEVLKLVTVERLFHAAKPKLLTIPWFAWGYRLVRDWLARLQALPAWQFARRTARAIRQRARRMILRLRRIAG